MKKKKVAAWLAALTLSIGAAAMTSLAAEGWAQSGSNWVYYDSYGDRVYNTWKKGADNLWRYLDGDGVMAVNSWVESEYYVNGDGIMYTDKWLKTTNDDGETEWYYFGSSGKVIKDTWKKIEEKWYHFDDEGRLELGWILDDMYYAGEDGVMRTGWHKLYSPSEDEENRDRIKPGYDVQSEGDGYYWYYFSSNGKKYVPTDTSSEYGARKIDGYYYCFNQEGAMQTGWQPVKNNASGIKDYMYFGSDGKAKIGWYSIEPPEELNGYEGRVEWFYFGRDGVPEASDSRELYARDLVKINGKSYLFNHLGNPAYGLKKVYSGSNSWTAYYFGTRSQSNVQKGKIKVTEGDGTKTDFYFLNDGKGYSGVKDGYLYYAGKLQEALNGQKYVCYRVNGSNYVVNSSGKVIKNTTVKNSDGIKLTVSGSGTLQKVDGESDISGMVEEPIEPVWDTDW